jgi:hypothetical protein
MNLPLEVVWEIADVCDFATLTEFKKASKCMYHIGSRALRKVMLDTFKTHNIFCEQFDNLSMVQRELVYTILVLLALRLSTGKTLTIVVQSNKDIRFPNNYTHYNTFDTVYVSCYTSLYAIENALLSTKIDKRRILRTNGPDEFFSNFSAQPQEIEMMVREDTCGENSKLMSLYFHF